MSQLLHVYGVLTIMSDVHDSSDSGDSSEW